MSPTLKRILVGVLAVMPLVVSGQESSDASYVRPALTIDERVVAPDPKPWAFPVYEAPQVDLSTGSGSIGVGLYSWTVGDYGMSVSLGYALGGHTLDEKSGIVGLGWDLSCAGMVYRDIAGQPDEETTFRSLSNAEIDALESENLSTDKKLGGGARYLADVEEKRVEAMYDRYHYKFPGHSGSFIIKGNTIIMLPADNVTITRIGEAGADKVRDFRIDLPDGTACEFTEREHTGYQHNSIDIKHGFKGPGYASAVTRWHLKRIITPEGADTITYHYATLPMWSVSRGHRSEGNGIAYSNYKYSYTSSSDGISATSVVRTIDGKLLSKISSRTATVEFMHQPRYGSEEEPQYISGFKVVSPEGTVVRECAFTAGKLRDGRRVLTKIEVKSAGVLLDGHEFGYEAHPGKQPGDFFGYANGKTMSGSQAVIDPATGEFNQNRRPDGMSAAHGAMSYHTTQAGVRTDFVYEPNTMVRPNTGDTLQIGIRLKSIRMRDAFTGRTRTREFSYSEPMCNIDFLKVGITAFVSLSGLHSATIPAGGVFPVTGHNVMASTLNASRLAGAPLASAKIYYGKVTEDVSGTGLTDAVRTEYEFDTSRCELQRTGGNGSAYTSNEYYLKKDIRMPDGSRPATEKLLSAGFANYYFAECNYAKPRLRKKLETVCENGTYRPLREKEYFYSLRDSAAYYTGLYHELLTKDYRNTLGVHSHTYKSLQDFVYVQTAMLSGRWRLDSVSEKRHYGAGELEGTREEDADGVTVITLHDALGREVLRRAVGEGGVMADTYTVSDAWGNPLLVLQPEGSKYLSDGEEWNTAHLMIDGFAFVYRYDRKLRRVSKRVPGCVAELTAYDTDGRVAYSRDGSVGSMGRKRFYLYDEYSRLAASGLCDDFTSEADWSAEYEAQTLSRSAGEGGSAGDYDWSSVSLPVAAQVTDVKYYDRYMPEHRTSVGIASPLGLVTAERTMEMEYGMPGAAVWVTHHYNAMGQEIQSVETRPEGDKVLWSGSYTVGGLPLQSNSMVSGAGRYHTLNVGTGYDAFGRVREQKCVTNLGGGVLLERNEYDGAGRLAGTVTQGGLRTTYSYDARGALMERKDSLLEMMYSYATGDAPSYAGRISGRKTRVRNGMGYDVVNSAYRYDAMGRLVESTVKQGTSELPVKPVFPPLEPAKAGALLLPADHSEAFTYDLNANVLTIERKGRDDAGQCRVVDDVEMTYAGNRLSVLRDAAADALLEGSMDMPEGVYSGYDIRYDAAGRLTRDVSRGIANINYSVTGMPWVVGTMSGDCAEYGYTSSGVKLWERIYNGNRTTRREYVGPCEYVDGKLMRVNVSQGYIDSLGVLHAYIRDIQGNVAGVYAAKAGKKSLEQLNWYYAYGGLTADSRGQDMNRYKHTEKELVTDLGLNSYDFMARWQYPMAGRFDVPDALAGTMSWLSPYAFCGGDPVNFFDPTGLVPNAYEASMMAAYVYNDADDIVNGENVNLTNLKETGWNISGHQSSASMNNTGPGDNGLQSVLFERTVDGVKEYAYVIAGTNSVEDVLQDIAQLLGLSTQYDNIIENSKVLASELAGMELTFVGHSLGGGGAIAASMATGLEAITFNPAAVSDATIWIQNLGNPGKVTNYITHSKPYKFMGMTIQGDPLNAIQDKLGLTVPGLKIPVYSASTDLFKLHGINTIANKFRSAHIN